MGEIDPLTWTMAYGAGRRSAQNSGGGYTAKQVVEEMRWVYDWCFQNIHDRVYLYCANPDLVWETLFPDGLPEFDVQAN